MIIELISIGIVTGFVSGFFAVGGGIILIPLLMLLGVEMKSAIGIATLQMMFSSYFGSFLNNKKGLLNLRVGIPIGLGGLIGALGSGYVTTMLSTTVLSMMLLVFILLSIYKFFNAPLEHNEQRIENRYLLFVIGLFTALVSVSVGMGGALFITPILVGFLNFKIKEAAPIALFFVIFASTSGLVSMSYFELVDYGLAIYVAGASLVGVYIGVNMAYKTDAKAYKKYMLTLNVLALIVIVYKNILG